VRGTIIRFAFVIPVLVAFSAGWAYGDVNLLGWNEITIDPTYTSPVIAPFYAPDPPYVPGGNFSAAFPLENLFGGQVLTAENTYDTIFTDGGPDYRNVYFHLTDLAPISIAGLVVDGAQDGPSNQSRSFSYFDLISYTFTDISNPGTYVYTLLYHGVPSTDVNGGEHIAANVNLTDVGPYFIYQFGLDPGVQSSGPRIFDVIATATAVPEPGSILLMGTLLLGVAGALKRMWA